MALSDCVRPALELGAASLYYLIAFTGGMNVLGLLFLLLLLTRFWPIVVIYLGWMIVFERNTQKRGGRSFGNQFMRRLPFFRYMRDYYPITLEKTAGLDPKKNYLFGYHPHGYIGEGAVIPFQTDACGFSEKYPGITPHMTVHSNLLMAFLYRDLIMALGFVDVARESLKYALTQLGPGHSVVVMVGGASEILLARQDTYVLTLKNRKGFIKLALETGAQLVPVFGFGQNNVLKQVGNAPGTRWFRLQTWLRDKSRKHLGVTIAIPLFHGRNWTIAPYKTPVNVVVGGAIPVTKTANPTQQEIDSLHETYMKELTTLFDSYRDKYNVSKDTKLIYVSSDYKDII